MVSGRGGKGARLKLGPKEPAQHPGGTVGCAVGRGSLRQSSWKDHDFECRCMIKTRMPVCRKASASERAIISGIKTLRESHYRLSNGTDCDTSKHYVTLS